MKHKGYEAVIRYSDEDQTFVGEVTNTSESTFQSQAGRQELERLD